MSPPVVWGFVGAGGVARRRMLPALRGCREVRLGAVMVRDQARAEALAAEFGVARAYDRVEALLADSELEAVYIATPPDQHAAQVIAAARAGKHVLVEKPMALSVADCDAMLAAAREHAVRLAVCFPLRHDWGVQQLRATLASGALGELTVLRAQMVKPYPLPPGSWRADPRQAGGGVLMDLGSHLLDLAVWLGGPLAALHAELATSNGRAVEDTAAVLLRFAGGALGTLEMSWVVGAPAYAIELGATAGRAVLDGEELRLLSPTGETRARVPGDDTYRRELLDFGAALRTGRPAATSGEDGRTNTAWLAAAYRGGRGAGRA
jgi:predicted dehydrogenase